MRNARCLKVIKVKIAQAQKFAVFQLDDEGFQFIGKKAID